MWMVGSVGVQEEGGKRKGIMEVSRHTQILFFLQKSIQLCFFKKIVKYKALQTSKEEDTQFTSHVTS